MGRVLLARWAISKGQCCHVWIYISCTRCLLRQYKNPLRRSVCSRDIGSRQFSGLALHHIERDRSEGRPCVEAQGGGSLLMWTCWPKWITEDQQPWCLEKKTLGWRNLKLWHSWVKMLHDNGWIVSRLSEDVTWGWLGYDTAEWRWYMRMVMLLWHGWVKMLLKEWVITQLSEYVTWEWLDYYTAEWRHYLRMVGL